MYLYALEIEPQDCIVVWALFEVGNALVNKSNQPSSQASTMVDQATRRVGLLLKRHRVLVSMLPWPVDSTQGPTRPAIQVRLVP